MSLNQEAHKSCGGNALVAFIGGLLSLALGLQCGWGTWGLVAAIFPCSAIGWILADWRGFVNAVKRSWRKVVYMELPDRWLRLQVVPRKFWREEVTRYNRSTGADLLFWLIAVPTILPVWTGLSYLLFFDAQPKNPPSVELAFVVTGALFFLWTFLCLIGVFMIWTMPDTKAVQIVKSLWGRTNAEVAMPKESLLKKYHPEIWTAAEAQTREWSRQMAMRWNPLVAPFILLGLAFEGLGWVIMRTPHAIGIAVITLTKVIRWCFLTSIDLARSVYFYANSSTRRIAFSSIALGMTVGFAVGYPLKLMLPGALLCGFATYLIGLAQHYYIYEPLVARRVSSQQD